MIISIRRSRTSTRQSPTRWPPGTCLSTSTTTRAARAYSRKRAIHEEGLSVYEAAALYWGGGYDPQHRGNHRGADRHPRADCARGLGSSAPRDLCRREGSRREPKRLAHERRIARRYIVSPIGRPGFWRRILELRRSRSLSFLSVVGRACPGDRP